MTTLPARQLQDTTTLLQGIVNAQSWDEIEHHVQLLAEAIQKREYEFEMQAEQIELLIADGKQAKVLITKLHAALENAYEDKQALEEEYAHLEGALENWHWIGDKALAMLLPDAVRDALRNAREQAFDEARELLEMEGLQGAINTFAGILSSMAGESKLHPSQTFVRLAEVILYGDSETLANDPRLSNALALALDGMG